MRRDRIRQWNKFSSNNFTGSDTCDAPLGIRMGREWHVKIIENNQYSVKSIDINNDNIDANKTKFRPSWQKGEK
jgi:hypothetical protein